MSGGGSALLPAPKNPLTLDEKLDMIKALSQSGAIIQELNTVSGIDPMFLYKCNDRNGQASSAPNVLSAV